jgi:endonuclease-3 related protein
MSGPTFLSIYKKLYAVHGPQHWWPGDGAFEVMVGAVLTQNTAWSNVEKAITNLKRAKALSPKAIAAAPPRKLAAWLKPSGYFNIKTKRLRAFCQWLNGNGGIKKLKTMPTDKLRKELLSVHGIGPETADDMLLYAFDRTVFVIDAYTRRIFQRLGLIEGNEDYETLRKRFEHKLKRNVPLYNEYHALIVIHGKDICRKKPRCDECCLSSCCIKKSIT